jgi:DNA-binding SARP family transcriptional activator/ABC-type transport system substrate-binding protein
LYAWAPQARASMDFKILGPLEVWDGARELPIRGRKQRIVFALLLLHANDPVLRDTLADALWGEGRPKDAAHALDVQISRLRKTLGPDRLRTDAGGYSLRVEPDELDLNRFERLREDASHAPPERAAALLREALALWRGSPLADLASESFAQNELAGLEDLRLLAIEDRIGADLALGRHAVLVPELDELVSRHPFREPLREDLMLALYRSGRQTDALRVYDTTRRLLADELGLEPGEGLRQLHRRILRQDPALESLPHSTSPDEAQPRPPSPRRRRRLVYAVLAAALLGGIGAAVVAATRSDAESPRFGATLGVLPSSIAFVEPGRDRLLGEVPITGSITGAGQSGFAFGEGAVWVATHSGLLVKIDPHSRRVTRSVSLGIEPSSVAVGAGSVWITDANSPTLLRIEPEYARVLQRIALPTEGAAQPSVTGTVAVGAGSLWVAHGLSRVARLDPDTGRLLASIEVPAANSVAVGDGSVWVAGSDAGLLARIDPATNSVVARVKLQPYLCCVAVGGGFVWAMNWRVWKLSPEGEILSSVPIDGDGANLTFSNGALWVAEGISGKVTRIDPKSDATSSFVTGGLVLYVGVSEGLAAVAVDEGPPDLTKGVKGPILHVQMPTDNLKPTDPAIDDPGGVPRWRAQLAYATCANLLNYPDKPAPAGWRLVPEIAAAHPSVSMDGRTYTFRIRRGYRFSPPSSEPVTAETVRYTIERALSPELGPNAAGMRYLPDVVGLKAFRSGRTAHVRGIVVRGNRLSITLEKPTEDLLSRIAVPAFCAVPIGTPIVPNGLPEEPIPSAGPYYLTAHLGGNHALLRRNPNYGGTRPHRFEAILYTMAGPTPAAVDRVERGTVDYVAQWDPALAPRSPVARRYGRSGDGEERRYLRTPLLGTDYLVFNSRSGLFADRQMRRAASYALDRPALAAAFHDLVTDQALPPGIPGFRDADLYPLNRPALRLAKALARGRGGRATFFVCNEPSCAQVGRIVRRNLARIGIAVSVKQVDDPLEVPAADIALARTGAPYPDPVAFLASLVEQAEPLLAQALIQLPARAATIRGEPRHAFARALDAELARDSHIAAFGTWAVPEFFSERVGCRQFQPVYFGVNLAALCLRRR